MEKENEKMFKPFVITSICREDLKGAGLDPNIDDRTMERLASKMANAYLDNGYWVDLQIIAEHLGIKRIIK